MKSGFSQLAALCQVWQPQHSDSSVHLDFKYSVQLHQNCTPVRRWSFQHLVRKACLQHSYFPIILNHYYSGSVFLLEVEIII